MNNNFVDSSQKDQSPPIRPNQSSLLESNSDRGAFDRGLIFSFPNYLSKSPPQAQRNVSPLKNTFDKETPKFNTPSLRERISPFSFRADNSFDDKSEFTEKQTQKSAVASHKICNCKIRFCDSLKCNCHKKNRLCTAECKCKSPKCKNRLPEIKPRSLSFKAETPKVEQKNVFEISFQKIETDNSEDKKSVIFYQNDKQKVRVNKKIEKLETKIPGRSKRIVSCNLQKFNC